MTEAGIHFCREAQKVVDIWQQFCGSVLPTEKLNRRKMRIVVSPRVYSNGLFHDIIEFFDTHTELDPAFVTEAGCDYLTSLRDQTIDLALDRMLSEDFQENGLYTCTLVREQQCVLMSVSDPRANLPSLSFKDLQNCSMISGLEKSAEDKMLMDTCRKLHITLNRVYRSDGIATNMELVRNGKSLGLGPKSFADYYQVAAVPLFPETTVSLDFICLQNSIHRKDIRQFRDYLLLICHQRGLLNSEDAER